MRTRKTNADAELKLTCPAPDSCGCKSSRVDCCSDAIHAHGRISIFRYWPPHRSFPSSGPACVDRPARPSKWKCRSERGQEESAHSTNDSSAPGDGAFWLRARPVVPATCSSNEVHTQELLKGSSRQHLLLGVGRRGRD